CRSHVFRPLSCNSQEVLRPFKLHSVPSYTASKCPRRKRHLRIVTVRPAAHRNWRQTSPTLFREYSDWTRGLAIARTCGTRPARDRRPPAWRHKAEAAPTQRISLGSGPSLILGSTTTSTPCTSAASTAADRPLASSPWRHSLAAMQPATGSRSD